MITAIYGLVANIFSGYWITTNTHWLVFGVTMTYMNYYKYHPENNA